MAAVLLTWLLACCSCLCLSSQSRGGQGIGVAGPPRKGAAQEDLCPLQHPEMATDLGLDTRSPAGPISAARSAPAHTQPWSYQDTTGSRPRPESWDQPSNRDLVELFDEFFNPKPQYLPNLPQHSVFTLRDTNQRVIRRRHSHLVATPQTPNDPPEQISVVPNQFLDPSNFPIIMGIDNGTRCLSCGMSALPTLMLEDKKIMDLYENSHEAKRFTFTCVASGSTHRFESTAFPGWFLSTAPRDDQPVRLTNVSGEADITYFYFRKM